MRAKIKNNRINFCIIDYVSLATIVISTLIKKKEKKKQKVEIKTEKASCNNGHLHVVLYKLI